VSITTLLKIYNKADPTVDQLEVTLYRLGITNDTEWGIVERHNFYLKLKQYWFLKIKSNLNEDEGRFGETEIQTHI
jgi:hypothetical protein